MKRYCKFDYKNGDIILTKGSEKRIIFRERGEISLQKSVLVDPTYSSAASEGLFSAWWDPVRGTYERKNSAMAFTFNLPMEETTCGR